MTEQPRRIIAGSEDKPLVINDVEIPCYVVEPELRVITQGGMLTALGRSRTPMSGTGGLSDVDKLPIFLRSRNFSQFISPEILMTMNPVYFRASSAGNIAVGYDARLLPMVCDAYLKARSAGVLYTSQEHMAAQCEILLAGFAMIGIIGLVDEATGYQQIRDERALAKILEAYIAEELQPWTKTFPYEFYELIFRLRGWDGPDGVKRPSVIGHYTNNFIYRRLPEGVLEDLQDKNPVLPAGYRKNKHHQWFTPEYGHPQLKEHIAAVTALMRASPNWDMFLRNLQRAFPLKEDPKPPYTPPDTQRMFEYEEEDASDD